jgi:carboxymethylenebutenolidase
MPDIRFPVADGAWPAYLAVPSATPGPWPAVVVIHEAFGLNDDIRAKAEEFAARGYLALAPDLFDGRSWIRCIRSAISQLRAGHGPAFAALDAARAFLTARPDCTGKAGVIGFCLGGGFALLCAPRPGFDVAAVNYGDVPKDAESVLSGACPIVN